MKVNDFVLKEWKHCRMWWNIPVTIVA